MHGKAVAICPPLNEQIGLMVETLATINTDQFGAFTGEVKRPDTQYQTPISRRVLEWPRLAAS